MGQLSSADDLDAAKRGDDAAFDRLVAPLRTELHAHCYRMLGSPHDADDALQDALVRAWRGLARFEGRGSLRSWLYTVATRTCLDTAAARGRRALPVDLGPASGHTVVDDTPLTDVAWLAPCPDPPADLYERRETVELAFVAALQHLPPRQRAALLLTEVLGWSAAEVAECLDMSIAAVNSALQRARATLASRNVTIAEEPLSDTESTLLDRYVDAFHSYDVDTLVSLLREDATLSMPPYTLWLRGAETIRTWLLGRGAGCRGSRLVPIDACGSRAFAQYRPGGPDPSTSLRAGGHQAWAIILLEPSGDQFAAWTTFLDTETLFPLFGLPLQLPAPSTPLSL